MSDDIVRLEPGRARTLERKALLDGARACCRRGARRVPALPRVLLGDDPRGDSRRLRRGPRRGARARAPIGPLECVSRCGRTPGDRRSQGEEPALGRAAGSECGRAAREQPPDQSRTPRLRRVLDREAGAVRVRSTASALSAQAGSPQAGSSETSITRRSPTASRASRSARTSALSGTSAAIESA